MEINNILVASDGSECGTRAVDLAVDLAQKYNAKLSALFVMDFRLAMSYDDGDDEGGRVLDEITSKGKDFGVVVVEHIITANPIDDMEIIISKINPDLVVIGNNGNGNAEDRGSVASNILDISKVPVMLVK